MSEQCEMDFVQGQKVHEYLDRIADIGWTGDAANQGRDCVAFTNNEDATAEEVMIIGASLQEEAIQKGLDFAIAEDPFGNIYLTLKGESDKTVMMCSHIDSVYRGGRYDGLMGVASGLEVLRRTIFEGTKPKKTIQVVAFRAEESSATGKACLGSSLATGNISMEEIDKIKHKSYGNKPLIEILLERGLSRENIQQLLENPYIKGDMLEAVIELHAEQSMVLEETDQPIGIVVHGIGGARRSNIIVGSSEDNGEILPGKRIYRITVRGKADHSGGTPMEGEIIAGKEMKVRRDALIAIARFLKKLPKKNLVNISIPGGGYNSVPGECIIEIVPDESLSLESILGGITDCLAPDMDVDAKLISKEEHDILTINERTVTAAMSIVCAIEKDASEVAKQHEGLARATIGDVKSEEGSLILSLDQRVLEETVGEILRNRIRDTVSQVAHTHETSAIEEPPISQTSPTKFEGGIPTIMTSIFKRIFGEDKEPIKIGSMPGHDTAMVIKAHRSDGHYVPGGMIFVRGRRGGISHNPAEHCDKEDINVGVNFLHEVVKEIAY